MAVGLTGYFSLRHGQQLLEVAPLRDGRGLDWLIVVIIPKSDFMGQIHRNTRTTILLCLVALGLATTFGVFTSRWIARPMHRLSRASQAITHRMSWELYAVCRWARVALCPSYGYGGWWILCLKRLREVFQARFGLPW